VTEEHGCGPVGFPPVWDE